MKYHTTSDFKTAVILLTEGFRIDRIWQSQEDRRRALIRFEDPDEKVDALLLDYVNGHLRVNIKQYLSNQEYLKSAVLRVSESAKYQF